MSERTAFYYTVSGIALLVFVILSAFFSSAEIAFAKCNKLRFEKYAQNGSKTAALVLRIAEDYTSSLSTILVGNNLVNIAASSLATVVAISLLGKARGETAATIITTAVILVFGETLPKIIAAAVPDSMAKLYAKPLYFSMVIFKPVVFVVNKFVNSLAKLWTKGDQSNVTSEELCEILEDIEEEGVFSEDESDLIRSAIEFTDTMAMDILVPRVDVFAIDIDEPLELSNDFYKHTRVPVYEGSIDNIIGIISTKKLIKAIASGEEPDIRQMMFEPIFVHKTRTISSILEEFRETHRQMAVVVDEYGGTMGILTLEDITEEIVGDIFDERDSDDTDIKAIGENEYEVDGGTNIYDLFDYIDFDEPSDFESDYITVGGWATEMLDKFPEAGDSFTYENLKITVTQAEAVRVNTVKVEVLPEEDEDD
ncbi:MAG: HlyC/CorC family transporter [Clostridia bacterium]|nr:HlyC/CorC family transporter [Clostridia bacterium]